MKIIILHLSDIHLASNTDPIFSRFEEIAATATSLSVEISDYIIAVSGDIANWGTPEQYEFANQFFNNLKESISKRVKKSINISIVFIPGNHDCNFSNAGQVEIRDAVLHRLPSVISTLTAESGLVKQSISIQQDFFDFISKFTQTEIIPEDKRLCYTVDIPISEKTLRFRCYNTAWVSQLHEKQGQMLFPTLIAKNALENESGRADLIVSMFHHPYNWLEQSNAHTFTQFIEQNSDIVLTGHEHIEDFYIKEKITGENLRYIAGAVLQERDTNISAFNVILIDLEKQQQRFAQYRWYETSYTRRELTDWFPFQRNRFLLSKGFINNEKFAATLQEIGTEYLHPFKKKGTLTLSDIFVYPDLKELTIKGKVTKEENIQGKGIVNHLLQRKYTIIYGDNNSGKTSLSKTLYTDFQAQELVPLLIRPSSNLSGNDDDSLRNCLNKAIEEQYSATLQDAFYKLEANKRVLIIDDFHKFRLNGKSQRDILVIAQQLFETIVIFASDVYQLQSLVDQSAENKALLKFTPFQIREYGRKLRGQIIRKWLKLGREMAIAPSDLSHEENQLENVLNGVISKNVIPAYPFWIISILQMWKSEQSSNGNFGAFGYIYDGLITKQLEELGYDATKIDTIYTFLGRIAYFLFQEEQEDFTIYDLSRIDDEYFNNYKVRINVYQLAEKLVEARILRLSEETFSFSQPYIFYFFVARYIKENLAAQVNVQELRSKVFEMIEHIAYEPYSYILLILVYLTKDRIFIEKIIEQAEQIYAELPPSDLNESVKFLNNLSPKIEQKSLPSPDFERNREEYWRNLDEMDEDDSISRPHSSPQMIRYHSDLDDLTKMIIAMRTMDLMGQILRNFPGSLFADIKLKLAQESYLLGLRTLQAYLKLAQESLEKFHEYYKTVIKEQRENGNKKDLNLPPDSLILWLSSGAAFGVIKRISVAVGHEDLEETYKDVKRNLENLTSVELIDLSIRLDHFRGVPHSQINKLAKDIRDNKFTFSLLKDLILHFLYMFYVEEKDRQKLASRLEINAHQIPLLTNDAKRSRKRAARRLKK
jgi:predicted MPP superfamily phosphohydrolase